MIRKLKSGGYRFYSRQVNPKTAPVPARKRAIMDIAEHLRARVCRRS
jgi:hypothetical protein